MENDRGDIAAQLTQCLYETIPEARNWYNGRDLPDGSQELLTEFDRHFEDARAAVIEPPGNYSAFVQALRKAWEVARKLSALDPSDPEEADWERQLEEEGGTLDMLECHITDVWGLFLSAVGQPAASVEERLEQVILEQDNDFLDELIDWLEEHLKIWNSMN